MSLRVLGAKFGFERSLVLPLGASPSGTSPMLSGERRMARHSGMPISKNMRPAKTAPQRQPQDKTMALSIGAINTPPALNEALLMVMARALRRINQLFVKVIGACMNPPECASEIMPR